MSDDEVSIAAIAAVFGVALWGGALHLARQTNPLARPGRRAAVAAVVLLASVGIVLSALLAGADPQVRSSPGLIVLFLVVAADSLAVAALAASGLGLSVLNGFVRGRNAAVGWAAGGLWLGVGLVNAGSNVGRGDTIYTTLGPLTLALGTLLVLCAILAAATGRFRAVRLDRDVPAGVRAGGLFVAWGLVLGRAVAGDWESIRRTWEDFVAYGWPVLALLGAAVVVEWMLRSTVRRPRVPWPAGVGPAVAYIAVAVELTVRS